MNISTPARLRGIDIRVRIHPDDGHVPAQPLADRLRGPGNAADGDRVVAAQRQHAAAFPGVRVDLVGELSRDGGDSEGVLHPADVGVGDWHEVFVGVHCVIVVEVVAQFFAELCEETA